MATASPRTERRRARPGSLERPVNGRLYRGTWLLVGLPLLIAAFSVVRPAPLPPPQVPPAFSGTDARDLAADLVNASANRFPGSVAAVNWFVEQLRPYVLQTRKESFTAVIPGFSRRRPVNVVAPVPGRPSQAIRVVAHRGDLGTGPCAAAN